MGNNDSFLTPIYRARVMEKSILRKEMINTLRSFDRKKEESKAICRALLSFPLYKEAESILAFSPLSTEPDISPLLNDDRVLFPFITGEGEMEFGKGEMVRNKLGFLEPRIKEKVKYNKAIILDLEEEKASTITTSREIERDSFPSLSPSLRLL